MDPGLLHVGCEPVPVLFFLFAGPASGAGFIAGSLAVFVLVIAAKCLVYGRLGPESFGSNAARMLWGNVVSTVVGFLVAGLLASSAFILPCLGGLLAVSLAAGPQLSAGLQGTAWARRGGGLIMAVLLIGSVVSALFFGVATQYTHPDLHPVLYWTYKVLAFFFGLGVSILLTALLEALVVARLSSGADRTAVLKAAVAANLWVFFGVFLIGALVALPVRMRRPRDFLMPARW